MLKRFLCCAALTGAALACGSDDQAGMAAPRSTLAGACDMVCGTLAACSALNGLTAEDCRRGCSREEAAAVSDGAFGCSITEDDAERCSEGLAALDCPALRRGAFPAACSFCEDDAARIMTGAARSQAAAGTEGCAELQACCEQMAPDQEALCNMVVEWKNAELCAVVLPDYRSAKLCR